MQVAEMRFNTTKDGHDQMPLRKVLWRRRSCTIVLKERRGRRCTRRTGRDPCAYLLWHNHRKKREEHKSPRTTARRATRRAAARRGPAAPPAPQPLFLVFFAVRRGDFLSITSQGRPPTRFEGPREREAKKQAWGLCLFRPVSAARERQIEEGDSSAADAPN